MTPAGGPCVVDASVVAAAFFADNDAGACRALLASGRTLHAPDLLHAEVANVIWRRRRLGEIDDQEAADLLADVLRLPLEMAPTGPLAEAALQIAIATDRTVYDCLYLALAVREDAVLLTGDQRLVNALAGSPLERHIAGISGVDTH